MSGLPRRRWRNVLCVTLSALFAAAVWGRFHDRFWYPPDEGNYAHVAERMLDGQVLNRDVQDVHAGYINVLNAGAMGLFGRDLLSLRYPLAAASILQAAAATWLFLPQGALIALIAGLLTTALSGVLFLDPTAHWYCLALTILLIAVLERFPREARGRLVIAGFLLGLIFLLRQLTGVFVAMGVLTQLFLEEREETKTSGPRLTARSVLIVALLGLVGYLAQRSGVLSFALLGVWPVTILGGAVWLTPRRDRNATNVLLWLAGGALLALLPLLTYHVLHGSVRSWLDDTVFSAAGMTSLDFLRQGFYDDILMQALRNLLQWREPLVVLHGLWWCLLLIAPALVGAAVLILLPRVGRRTNGVPVWVVIAPFYAVVSLHYQIPIYLYYGVAMTVVAATVLAARKHRSRIATIVIPVAAAAVAGISLTTYAARPLYESLDSLVRGDPLPDLVPSSLPRCSLLIPEIDEETYAALLEIIDQNTKPEDAILALPSDAELYFLSGRRNPTRFYNSALALRSDQDVTAVFDLLAADPPRLIFWKPEDKYATPLTKRLMSRLWWHYQRIDTIEGIEVYRAWLNPPRLSR